MSTNTITQDGDWTSMMVLSGTQEQIAIDVKTKLQEQKNDCFFNAEAGIDWDFYLSNKLQTADFEKLKAQILEVCYQVANVLTAEITNFNYNQAQRELQIAITINQNILVSVNL